ncbi:MAG TPA: AAA family ATPase [Pyrinomonadaceae bacterium]|nr:AAA family ATPase [Pyrinomonadaceae bacterium]
MKLIIIYGAPAVGKLTVAAEVARRTGFKLFHNHVSIDCVRPVFEFGTPPFLRLIESIRFATIGEAAREGVDLIHTFVYARGEDDDHFRKLIASAEDNGGEAHLVLLTCEPNELKERIGNESRVKIGKLSDPDSVDWSLSRYDLRSPFPDRPSLELDTTDLEPDAAATRIIDHFALATQAGEALRQQDM